MELLLTFTVGISVLALILAIIGMIITAANYHDTEKKLALLLKAVTVKRFPSWQTPQRLFAGEAVRRIMIDLGYGANSHSMDIEPSVIIYRKTPKEKSDD